MTEIRLYNTATRRKETLTPVEPGRVSMYVCGPTVYDRAHLGNARPAVVFDVLFRLLRHEYGADNVRYVRNITDVEDKIIARATERGISIAELTRTTEDWYHQDMAALGVLPVSEEPHATGYIPQMVAMIETLVAQGHAYAAKGHVLFAVESYADYGRLSGRSVEDMVAGARVEVAPYKRNPMDFVLWKPSTGDQPGWDSPWGRGRPGWHIECSAMARALLGGTFDIHGGGNDLMFPHHENEIAQSRCAHPDEGFARIWMHNEMLQVEGKKMSKSLGNFFTVRDLLDQGVSGEVIRFVMLSTHYRKPMDWTEQKRREAEATLEAWAALSTSFSYLRDEGIKTDLAPGEVISSLADDLNTSAAMTELIQLMKRVRQLVNTASSADHEIAEGLFRQFLAGADLVGLDFWKFTTRYLASERFMPAEERLRLEGAWVEAVLKSLLQERADARSRKDFARADAIRDGIAAAGVKVHDKPEGFEFDLAENFDPKKLEALQ